MLTLSLFDFICINTILTLSNNARRLEKSFYATNIYTSLNAETCMLFMSLVQCDKTNKTFRIEHNVM